MEGLVEQGAEVIAEDFEGALMNAALIGAAQRVEHYEIAAYGTVCAFAVELGGDGTGVIRAPAQVALGLSLTAVFVVLVSGEIRVIGRPSRGRRGNQSWRVESGEQSGEQIHPNEAESPHLRGLAPTCKLLGRLKRQDRGRFSKPPPSATRPPLRRFPTV